MIILIDANNLCYIAHYTVGDLSIEEKRVGVIFGFMKKLLVMSRDFDTNEFAFFFDHRRSYRRVLYPQYKHKRRENLSPQEYLDKQLVYEQVDELRSKLLPQMGFNNVFSRPGYEADDLIAEVALNVRPHENVIVSGDHDLYQLLTHSKGLYNAKAKKLYTAIDFEKEFGVGADRWAEVKSYAGCSTDNVEGIKGVGEKTAIKYLLGQLKGKKLQAIENGKQCVPLNQRLVCLPFRGPKPLKIELQQDNLTQRMFFQTFDSLRFNSFIKDFDKWIGYFRLK